MQAAPGPVSGRSSFSFASVAERLAFPLIILRAIEDPAWLEFRCHLSPQLLRWMAYHADGDLRKVEEEVGGWRGEDGEEKARTGREKALVRGARVCCSHSYWFVF